VASEHTSNNGSAQVKHENNVEAVAEEEAVKQETVLKDEDDVKKSSEEQNSQ
jgi:predicted GIY-YIG superfamily endonuclease